MPVNAAPLVSATQCGLENPEGGGSTGHSLEGSSFYKINRINRQNSSILYIIMGPVRVSPRI